MTIQAQQQIFELLKKVAALEKLCAGYEERFAVLEKQYKEQKTLSLKPRA